MSIRSRTATRQMAWRVVALAVIAAAAGSAYVWYRSSRDGPANAATKVATRTLPAQPLDASRKSEDRRGEPLAIPSASVLLEREVTANPFGVLNAQSAQPALPVASQPTMAASRPKPVASSPPLVIAPPAAPTAPALPFTSIGGITGKDIAGGAPVAFLKHNEDVLVVRVGDEIARTYRVEALSADRIEFTYLPLNQRQVLPLQN